MTESFNIEVIKQELTEDEVRVKEGIKIRAKALGKDSIVLLLNLISSHKVITSKVTNATNNKLKEEAWKSIAQELSALTGEMRRPDQLRLKWENLKKAARKRSAFIRQNNLKVEADPFAFHFDQEESDEEKPEAPTKTGTMLSQLPPYYYQSYAQHMTSPQRNKRKSVPRKVLVQPSTDEDTEVTTNDIQSTEGKTRKRGRKKYDKLFACEYCDKIYSIKAKLVVHTRMHTGERPYGCSVCSKMFRTRGTAISHENSHLGLKPYACDLCDKSYTSNQQLKIHIRSHTGERPYACAVCQKDFKDRWKLTLHVQTHTGLRPYACDKCDKKYTTKYQLTTHYRLHTREKLFECEICTRQFVERCKLEKHRKIHLGVKPFRCALCDKNYRQKSHLKFHIESAHSDNKS